jgi:hypothetical protein
MIKFVTIELQRFGSYGYSDTWLGWAFGRVHLLNFVGGMGTKRFVTSKH